MMWKSFVTFLNYRFLGTILLGQEHLERLWICTVQSEVLLEIHRTETLQLRRQRTGSCRILIQLSLRQCLETHRFDWNWRTLSANWTTQCHVQSIHSRSSYNLWTSVLFIYLHFLFIEKLKIVKQNNWILLISGDRKNNKLYFRRATVQHQRTARIRDRYRNKSREILAVPVRKLRLSVLRRSLWIPSSQSIWSTNMLFAKIRWLLVLSSIFLSQYYF